MQYRSKLYNTNNVIILINNEILSTHFDNTKQQLTVVMYVNTKHLFTLGPIETSVRKCYDGAQPLWQEADNVSGS